MSENQALEPIAAPLTDEQIAAQIAEAESLLLMVAGNMNPHLAIAALIGAASRLARSSNDGAYLTGVASLLDEEAGNLRKAAITLHSPAAAGLVVPS